MAGCILRREWRDIVRRELGPEVVVVVLTMEQEATLARLQQRHQDSQREVRWLQVELNEIFSVSVMKYFQSIGRLCGRVEEGEERVVEVEVGAERTREEILQTVMETIQLNIK